MKESHRKGVASHPDPESCMASREAAIEAFTGAHAGSVLSCEIIATGVPTSFRMAEGNTGGCAIASIRRTSRASYQSPPTGEERRAPSKRNTKIRKLMSFLENSIWKHLTAQ